MHNMMLLSLLVLLCSRLVSLLPIGGLAKRKGDSITNAQKRWKGYMARVSQEHRTVDPIPRHQLLVQHVNANVLVAKDTVKRFDSQFLCRIIS